jgi:hypothetical protein
MSAVTFDTLQAVETLRAKGFTEEQAKGITAAIRQAHEEGLATKDDVSEVKHEIRELGLGMDTKIETLRGELVLIKWMLGFVLAGVMSIVIKLFIR